MEELLAKFLVQYGPIGSVLVVIYLVHELSRLQKFVEDQLTEIKEVLDGHGDQINLLDKKGAVFEEKIKHAGKPMRRGDD